MPQGHYTHEKNPVGCAAGLATIDYVFDEGLMENAEAVGAHCLERMRGMMERQPMIGDVRGIGLLMGIVSRMSCPSGDRVSGLLSRAFADRDTTLRHVAVY